MKQILDSKCKSLKGISPPDFMVLQEVRLLTYLVGTKLRSERLVNRTPVDFPVTHGPNTIYGPPK